MCVYFTGLLTSDIGVLHWRLVFAFWFVFDHVLVLTLNIVSDHIPVLQC